MTFSLLAVSAVTPSLLLIWYFQSRDLFPEPHRIIWITFGLGISTVVPVLFLVLPFQDSVAAIPNPYLHGLADAFLLAAIPEELCKFLVLYVYCVRHHEFNEPMDGVVYGVTVSLGFATLENVLYVSHGGFGVALTRALSAVPCHAFLGAIMGHYLGEASHRAGLNVGLLMKSLGWPILLHGLYDFPLLSAHAFLEAGQSIADSPGVWSLALVPLVLGALFIWTVAIVRVQRVAQLAVRPAGDAAAPELAMRRPRGLGRAWIRTLLGGVLATAGGILALGLIVALCRGEIAAQRLRQVLVVGALVSLFLLLSGVLLYWRGIDRINRAYASGRRAS